jgi:hypothetical protein
MEVTLKFVVCGNTETVQLCSGLCEEAADALTRETLHELRELSFVGFENVDLNSNFSAWNGGGFSTGNRSNQRFGIACCVAAVKTETIIDDDGDEEESETEVNWKDLPADLRAELESDIDAALDRAQTAADKVHAQWEKDEAEFAAQRKAEEENESAE